MNQKSPFTIEQIIKKLTNLLEITYIFKTENACQPLMLIILNDKCTTLSQDLSSMVAKIIEDASVYHYRILSYEYAHQQLNDNNLFFVYSCQWEHCIYKDATAEVDVFFEYHLQPKTLSIIKARFDKEKHKIAAFMDGADFFVEQGNLAQAAFMLHQCMELWYRYAGLFLMGKERKSHSIKELQTYLRAFSPSLGHLFDTEKEEEQQLIKLLDEAYITTRYGNSYHINSAQINTLQEKAQELTDIVTLLFNQTLEACTQNVSQPKDTPSPEHEAPLPQDELLTRFITSLSEKDFPTLKPYYIKKGLYKVGIVTEGYMDTSFMISNMIKVCILALEADVYENYAIRDPKFNVKEVLRNILSIIPHEEMELLDVLRGMAPNASP